MQENSSDGYQSKSKMPEISMKRLRNAIFLFALHIHYVVTRFAMEMRYIAWFGLNLVSVLGCKHAYLLLTIIFYLNFISKTMPSQILSKSRFSLGQFARELV